MTPHRTSTPWSAWTAAIAAPIAAPSPRINGAGALSSTSTSLPSVRAVAATSRPMNPAPMTTTRRPPSAIRARRSSESSTDRSTTTSGRSSWPGSVRGREPVARIAPSNRTCSPPSSSIRRCRGIEPHGAGRQPPVDVERRDVVGLAQRDPVDLPLAREQPLRERRAIVRQVALVADHGDRAVEAGGAQRLGGTKAGERGTDDDDVAHHASIRSTSGPYGSLMVPTEITADAINAVVRELYPGASSMCVEVGADYAVAGLRRRPAHGATGRVRVRSDAVRDRRRRARGT